MGVSKVTYSDSPVSVRRLAPTGDAMGDDLVGELGANVMRIQPKQVEVLVEKRGTKFTYVKTYVAACIFMLVAYVYAMDLAAKAEEAAAALAAEKAVEDACWQPWASASGPSQWLEACSQLALSVLADSGAVRIGD